MSDADRDPDPSPPEPVVQPAADETGPSEPLSSQAPEPADASPFPAPEMEDFLGGDDPPADGILLNE